MTTRADDLEVAASPARAAYTNTYARGNARYQTGSTGTSLFAGPLSGPLAQLATCTGDLYPPFSGAVAVDQDAVAHVGCEGALVVRNFAPGAAVPLRTFAQPAGSHVTQIALAGRYVAYTRTTTGPVPRRFERTVVADWVAGREAYSLPAEDDFDVDASGNLAVAKFESSAFCGSGRLLWYSVAQPTPHPLPHAPCRPGVRIAGGAIAAALDGGRLGRVLGVVDLAGRRRDIAVLGTEGVQRGEIDFDGARLAYALGDCSGAADLHLVDGPSNAAHKPISTSCPVRIRSRRLALRSRGRSVRASIVCPRGCTGRARLERRVRRGRRTRSVRLGSSGPFKLRAVRCRTALPLALNRRARRLVRTRRRVSARLVLSTTDRAGRPRVKRARVALAAPGGKSSAVGEVRGC